MNTLFMMELNPTDKKQNKKSENFEDIYIRIVNNSKKTILTSLDYRLLRFLGRNIIKAISFVNSPISDLSLLSNSIIISEGSTITGTICGGMNGCGEWNNYFNTLSNFVAVLKEYFGIDAWLIKLTNDCPDDVFYAEFGFRPLIPNDNQKIFHVKDSPDVINYFNKMAMKSEKNHSYIPKFS